MRQEKLRRIGEEVGVRLIVSLVIALAVATPAHAGWLKGSISSIRIINDGSFDGVRVETDFSTGCSSNAFLILNTDPYFSEIYSQMLTAKVAGREIEHFHVYCSNGLSRGNQFIIH